MKKIVLTFSLASLLVGAISTATIAQEKPERIRDASKKIEDQNRRGPVRGEGRGMLNIPNATEEQKVLLKELNDKRQENEKALEATYDAKQKEIAGNNSLNFRDKRTALADSYNDTQKELVKKQAEELRIVREKLFKTLTEEQRSSLRQNGPRMNN